jgi:hypothetical protein
MLISVDQNLRVIYAEYTLAATDLGHVTAELIRYRTSVVRAIEADRKEGFQRIMTSLRQKRARLSNAMERFLRATNDTPFENRLDARELAELKMVQDKLDAYMSSSRHALQLIEERWNSLSSLQADRLQTEAKKYLANDAGAKYMDVTLELDRLLEIVGAIGGEVKKEADSTLRVVTLFLIAVSLVLGLSVLTVPLK